MDQRLKPMTFGIRGVDDTLMAFAEAMRAIERGEKVYAYKVGHVYFVHAKAFKNHLVECFAYMSYGIHADTCICSDCKLVDAAVEQMAKDQGL